MLVVVLCGVDYVLLGELYDNVLHYVWCGELLVVLGFGRIVTGKQIGRAHV